MSRARALGARAEGLGAALPPLLAQAQHLAAGVILGEHGRRRPGQGHDFWQYRPAHAGDLWQGIDWRRSGRSDGHFVREREGQAAQTVHFWVDPGASMRFASAPGWPEKAERAQVLALALAALLLRGGERVGLLAGPAQPFGAGLAPASGRAQLRLLAEALAQAQSQAQSQARPEPGAEWVAPPRPGGRPGGLVVVLSDFLGPWPAIEGALSGLAAGGARLIVLQVLDPSETRFPFAGRVEFRSAGGGLAHQTHEAADLKDRYLARLAARQDGLARLAQNTGGRFLAHDTEGLASLALAWAYRAIDGGGR